MYYNTLQIFIFYNLLEIYDFVPRFINLITSLHEKATRDFRNISTLP